MLATEELVLGAFEAHLEKYYLNEPAVTIT